MEKIIKQCVGIDCAKDDFTVTFSICDTHREISHLSSRTFLNNDLGFKAFNKWTGKLYKRSIDLLFVMEATGVYHERLAHFLYDLGRQVVVVLPKRAKDFSKTLKIKKVTDKISSQSLATMGLEKKLDLWRKPERVYADLKHLTREKEQIQGKIVETKNELHAEQSGVWPNQRTLDRLNDVLMLLEKQKKAVLKEIQLVVDSKQQLKEKIERITTIPGVGLMTAATVIGETNGFSQVKNKRQLVSYAGYDVIYQESGASVKTKPRISKRGNKHIRKAMHMPSLASIRKGGENKELFVRLVSKSGIKMKGVVAVQRKLLVLIYTLWKNGTEYDPEYELKKRGQLEAAPGAGSSPLF
jgi:transposase